ncbi:hypothetical protein NDU88_002646 [Pleurodeles waltl]|uniref:Uncharacterized protein n=1 Tax=Pleurodeles waltl TaxID=8319 RepID=A0AAV7WQJ2_PLEWA|nr:hypothetical protein NDU88_002646 [Pleurodeles waltl]
MGKTSDSKQSKLQFEGREVHRQMEVEDPPSEMAPESDFLEVKQLVQHLQPSITVMIKKIDKLNFKMDTIAARLEKHEGRLTEVAHRISSVEDLKAIG